MPSEEQVRAGVHRIANSIEVDADQHLAAVLTQAGTGGGNKTPSGLRRRSRLVSVAAAVAVVGVVAAGAALTGVLPDRESGADRVAPTILGGTPEGTVPSVFAHTRESAGALLEDRGLTVRYDTEISCDPAGRPIGTEPPTGTQVKPGATVTVLLAYQGGNTDCAVDLREPWRFVDFATGRGPSPQFADEVDLFVDGVRTSTLSGADAATGEWGADSALAILAEATGQVRREGDAYRTPLLEAATGTPPDTWCGVRRPQAAGDREALTLTVDFAELTVEPRCPARVALYQTDGAIDTVIAWSAGARGSALVPIPDVVGLGLAKARDTITAAGYPARVEELETCHPRDGVVEQAPTQQALDEDSADDPGWYGPVTLVVEVPHSTRDCAGLDAAASAFMRFSRGGPPPAWSPQVLQLLGYTPWATVTAEGADDPAAWAFCSGVAPENCEASPLAVVAATGEIATGEFSEVTRWPEGQSCELIDRGGLPSGLPLNKQILLYPARLTSCADDWSVWLWLDEAGRITAVNLLVPASSDEG